MKVNLALHIFVYLVQNGGGAGGAGVPLSGFRMKNNIPRVTFHNHINSLIATNMIVRVGRDKYLISDEITAPIVNEYKQWVIGELPF